ncbi:putative tRNA pseudouridine synthase C25B8.05 [Triticum aestivum]|nr:putative tRNA pseudouridine synthase C25B8.05 [Triticum aestivum]
MTKQGEHDLRNFCKMDAANVSNYKRCITDFTISACDQRSNHDELWFMNIRGSAFLWHQVCCMVAVLFLVGQGLESPSVVDSLLDITRTPRKPQYTMAPELPLILRSCLFDRVSFMCSSGTYI